MSDIENNAKYDESPQRMSSRDFQPSDSHEETLQKIRTAGSLSISPELFEQLYLTPKTRVKGTLRATLGNPSPLYVEDYSRKIIQKSQADLCVSYVK